MPSAGGRLEKMLKRIRRAGKSAGSRRGAPASGYMQTVADASTRTKLANRYCDTGGLVGAIKRLLSKMIFLSDSRREAVSKKLIRAGYKASPEMFYSDVIMRTLAVLSLAPVLVLLDNNLAAAATVLLAIGLYYKWIGEPDERIKKLSSEISDELPRFVSVLSYSMATDRDLARAVGRYIKIAKPALRGHLELLLLEMKAGNDSDALKRFDSRIGNSQLSAFVSGLIDAGRGVDQRTFFYLMEENMKLMFIENRKKELARRPAKVKKAIIATGLCMFLLYLVPICIQLADGLSMFQ